MAHVYQGFYIQISFNIHTFKILMGVTLMFECPGVQVWLLLAAEVVFLSLFVCLFVYFPKRNEM